MADKDETALAAEQELTQPPADGNAKPVEREPEKEPAPQISEAEADKRAEELETKHKFVRKEALDEERIARKNAERDLRAMRDQQIRLEERINSVARPQQQEVVPNAEEDIFAAHNHLAKEVEQLRGVASQYQQNNQQQAAQQQLVSAYRADAEQFRTRTPDFLEAYNHYRSTRQRELQSMGYGPEVIGQALEQDEIAIAQQAFSVGRSPAETIYALAGVRGYQKKAPDNPLLGQQNTGVAQVQRLAAAQGAGVSLANAGGGTAGNGKITVESLANMSNEDFSKWFKAHGDDGLRKVMGAN